MGNDYTSQTLSKLLDGKFDMHAVVTLRVLGNEDKIEPDATSVFNEAVRRIERLLAELDDGLRPRTVIEYRLKFSRLNVHFDVVILMYTQMPIIAGATRATATSLLTRTLEGLESSATQ